MIEQQTNQGFDQLLRAGTRSDGPGSIGGLQFFPLQKTGSQAGAKRLEEFPNPRQL